MSADNWQELLEEAKKGDSKAIEALCEHLRARILKVAKKRVLEEAEDVTQDTIMTFLKMLPELPPQQEALPLCFRILWNKIGNLLRKRERRRPAELSEKDEPRDPHTPDTLLASKAVQDRIRAAVECVGRRSEDYRKISDMLRSESSVEEIRQAFGYKSVGAVHSLLFRFRGKLKEELKGDLETLYGGEH